MSLKLKTAPAEGAVTLVEAKDYLRISDTQDDLQITSLIHALTERAELWTGRAWIDQSWTLWLDSFPFRDNGFAMQIEIPRPPLQSVTHLKTYDSAGVGSVLSDSAYLVDSVSVPGRIVLQEGHSWPSGGLRSANAIEIEFTAGYGSASDVPSALREGILLWMKILFAGKTKLFESDESTPGLANLHNTEIPPQTKVLWQPYQLMRL
jgi:uncharacterized phiE125 gp8 family phage protein